jgi:GAF domain-containing protein
MLMATDSIENLSHEALVTRLRRVEAELRLERADSRFADDLRQGLLHLGTTAQLAAPIGQGELLRLIVGTAAQVLAARVAVLYLIDREANELVLELALGEPVEEARRRGRLPANAGRLRAPLGTGIAGWVAISGQPVARSDVAQDPRFPRAIAERIGYLPETTLCLPLRAGDTVIGVIQLFDKAGGESFTTDDMQLLEQFGAAAAIALEQARLVHDLTQVFGAVLRGLLAGDAGGSAPGRALETDAAAFAERVTQSERYREALEIARLVSEIGSYEPDAGRHCKAVLASLAALLREQASRSTAGGWLP